MELECDVWVTVGLNAVNTFGKGHYKCNIYTKDSPLKKPRLAFAWFPVPVIVCSLRSASGAPLAMLAYDIPVAVWPYSIDRSSFLWSSVWVLFFRGSALPRGHFSPVLRSPGVITPALFCTGFFTESAPGLHFCTPSLLDYYFHSH